MPATPPTHARLPVTYQHPLRRRRRQRAVTTTESWVVQAGAPAGLAGGQRAVSSSSCSCFRLNLLQQSRITALSAEVVRLRAVNQQMAQQLQGQTQQLALFLAADRNVALGGTAR